MGVDERAKEFTGLVIALRSKMMLGEMNIYNSPFGSLNISDISALFLLFAQGSLKMRQLADLMKVPYSTLTGIIDRLVKHGYVQRKTSENDRRVILVCLTDKGVEFYKWVSDMTTDLYKKLLVTLEEDEQEQLIGYFRKMTANFSADES